MPGNPTVPRSVDRIPIRSVTAVVVEGPDAGRTSGSEADSLSIGTAANNDLALTDPTVSGYHLDVRCLGDELVVRDLGSTNGTYLGAVRVVEAAVPPNALLRLGATTVRLQHGTDAEVVLHQSSSLGGLRGRSPVMRRLMALTERVARLDSAVLIVGESGTGKEELARAIHELGPRADKPFVTVDCGSLSPTLTSSELFGHERGAFTGADQAHAGAFERAGEGTVFLDEIGELPRELQPMLLGVLERRRFRRLGGKAELSTHARFIAATNRDLRAEVNQGRFRLDLFFRLAVVRLEAPPLRSHPEDIPLMVEKFLADLGREGDARSVLGAETLQRLSQHAWPGNVRELRNFVEVAVALGEAPGLEAFGADPARAEGEELLGPGFERLRDVPYHEARKALSNVFERRYLQRLLERTRGNVAAAAKLGDINRSHLFEMLKRHGLRGASDE